MNFAIRVVAWYQSSVEELPPEVVDELPADVLSDLREGIIDKIPEDVVDTLPEGVRNQVPESLIDFASENTGFVVFLAVLGVLSVMGFLWGIAKGAVKAIVFFGVVGAAAWFLFFQQ